MKVLIRLSGEDGLWVAETLVGKKGVRVRSRSLAGVKKAIRERLGESEPLTFVIGKGGLLSGALAQADAARRMAEEAEAVLAQAREKQKDAVVAFAGTGMTYRDIAEATGLGLRQVYDLLPDGWNSRE